jgi:hypothetical protein
VTPGRAVKFTATTGQRHETWFNALSYLLLRTGDEAVGNTAEIANGLTREDVDEFNPGFRNNSIRQAPASLSSYNSRKSRRDSSVGIPHQSPAQTRIVQASTSSRPSIGTFSRLSTYLKASSGQMSSHSTRRSRQSAGRDGSIYQASEVHDSAEDLREIIEKQDRESDKLEDVRACCDGRFSLQVLELSPKLYRQASCWAPTFEFYEGASFTLPRHWYCVDITVSRTAKATR